MNLHKRFQKFCPVGVAVIRADWRADMTRLLIAFHNCFANVPKNWHLQTSKFYQQSSSALPSLRIASRRVQLRTPAAQFNQVTSVK
jgi:hypothetical protein